MLLGKTYGEAEETSGQWFVWKQEGDEKIELLIRPMPPADRKRIRAKHLGKRRRQILTDRGWVQDVDVAAQAAARLEMVAFCLLDSRGFTFPVGPELAKQLTKYAVPVGEDGIVTIDGHIGASDPGMRVKDLILNSYPIGTELLDFVDKQVTKLLGEAEEEEEQASGN